MTCPKCGANNIDGSSFCIKCGTNLKESHSISSNIKNVNEELEVEQSSISQVEQQTLNSQNSTFDVSNNNNLNIDSSSLNYLPFIISVLFKPFKSFKDEESKLCNSKTSLILSSIVAGSMMIITLLTTVFSAIFQKKFSYVTYDYKTSVDFSRLKDLDWISLIGKNLLIYAGIVVGIAGVYYIVSLIFKKSANFIKYLSISATSLVPYVVLGMIVSPLIGKIWTPLSMFAVVIGAVYSLLIFINLIGDELSFDSVDLKIYFHLICLSIVGSSVYYLYMKFIMSGISSSISDIFDMFG